MKILLTNDDGVDAPGLQASHSAMIQFLSRIGVDQPESCLIVVAPDRCRSECGHSVTTGRDLILREVQTNWYCLDGTPVDCVRVALNVLCPDAMAVISGVNAGANVGIDLLVSGTFAAAREGALQNRPSIAISHYRRPDVPKTWDCTGDWLQPVLKEFWDQCVATKSNGELGVVPLWNVNLPALHEPDLPPVVHCDVEPEPLVRRGEMIPVGDHHTVQLRSDFHGRPRQPGTDVDHCFGGKITISRLLPYLSHLERPSGNARSTIEVSSETRVRRK